MDPQSQHPWGERLAAEGAAAGSDQSSVRRLLRDAAGVVKGRLGEVTRAGIRPLLDEAATQVRPATTPPTSMASAAAVRAARSISRRATSSSLSPG